LRGYKKFIFAFAVLLAIYILAEMNRPRPVNWDVTLSKDDKQPYGGYILFHQLKDIFPRAAINAYRLPVYNQVNNFYSTNTAYMLIDPTLQLGKEDLNELMSYVHRGNYAFIASENFSKALMDTLHFHNMRKFDFILDDTSTMEFKNPSLRTRKRYYFKRMTVDGYIDEFDTASTVVLATNRNEDVNFVRIAHGKGAFFIHASPVCFSNYFMVSGENADYTSIALSYLPKEIKTIFWDEYYKLGPTGSNNPLRFLLNDPFLRWAFRIAVITMILFVLFEMKRRQRIIPTIPPLKNTTLDFVRTVGNVYFNQRDNKNIALKKISYFLEHVRSVFFLQTSHFDNEFKEALSAKSGVQHEQVNELFRLIEEIQNSGRVGDQTLLVLNKQIDSFYEKAK
jgi:hypothetical protein